MAQNKTNTIEIIFIIIVATFILTLLSLVILNELGYIQTGAKKCNNQCLENNLTGKYDNEVCRCCDPPSKISMSKSTIEEQCHEVLLTND